MQNTSSHTHQPSNITCHMQLMIWLYLIVDFHQIMFVQGTKEILGLDLFTSEVCLTQ